MVSKAKKSEESHNGSTEQQTRKSIQKKRRWVVGKHHHQEWWQRNSGWKGERGLWLWHGWDVIWNIKILGEFCQVARSNPAFYLFRVYLELFGVTKCLIHLGKLIKTALLASFSCFLQNTVVYFSLAGTLYLTGSDKWPKALSQSHSAIRLLFVVQQAHIKML